jgi:hypothetical protein
MGFMAFDRSVPPCLFCQEGFSQKTEWTLAEPAHRQEFFRLLAQEMDLPPDAIQIPNANSGEAELDLCSKCTCHIQRLTSLFKQLQQLQASFKKEARDVKAAIVDSTTKRSFGRWCVLRDKLVSNRKLLLIKRFEGGLLESSGNALFYLASVDLQGAVILCDDSASHEGQCLGEIVIPSSSEHQNGQKLEDLDDDYVQYIESEGGSDDSDEDRKSSRARKRNTEMTSSRKSRSRGKHPVWEQYEQVDDASKACRCKRCKRVFQFPQCDRLVRHFTKCNGQVAFHIDIKKEKREKGAGEESKSNAALNGSN